MRSRNARTRWLLVAVLAAAPGCLFRPIFHPPSSQDRDGGLSFDSASATDVTSRDAAAPLDAASGIDAPQPPPDDCRDYFDSATGMYYPDAHHQDGALCELPTDAGESDAAIDVTPPDAENDAGTVEDANDAGTEDANADAVNIEDAATEDAATDDAEDATSDDASTSDDGGDDAPSDPDV